MKIHRSQIAAIDRILECYTREVKSVATQVLQGHGFDGVRPTPNAPSTYEELVRWYSQRGVDKLFPVFDGGNTNTVFDHEPMVNYLFRAWHDIGHLVLNAEFTAEGERAVAQWQAKRLTGINKSILMVDTVEQDNYFRQHGQFLDDQRAFVISHVFGEA